MPGGDPARWRRIATIAIQRWSTFPRRHPDPATDTPSRRAEDLARGLLDRCPRPDPRCTLPDIKDYRALAAHLAPVLAATPPPRIRHPIRDLLENLRPRPHREP